MRQGQKGKLAVGYLLTTLLLLGCWGSTGALPKYGLGYNPQREKLGIPTIPTNWTLQDIGKFIDCFDPNPNQKAPHRLAKRIFLENGAISREVDTFYSGTNFYYPPERLTLPQEISIQYDYAPASKGNPWKAYADLSADERLKPVSIGEARRILATWGLRKSDVGGGPPG